MSDDFISQEFKERHIQHRYYDDRQISLLKFSVILSSSAATAVLTIAKLISMDTPKFWLALALLAFVVALGNNIIYFSMVVNRLYFIREARQINAIRKYFVEHKNSEFQKFNRSHLSSDFPVFRFLSIHSLFAMSVCGLGAIFFSITSYSVLKYFGIGKLAGDFIFSAVFGALIMLLSLLIGYFYLTIQDKKDKYFCKN